MPSKNQPEIMDSVNFAIAKDAEYVHRMVPELPENEAKARKMFNEVAAGDLVMLDECIKHYKGIELEIPTFEFCGNTWPANEVPEF